MSKTRMINTRFWNDGYISELDPVEKLLFIYLLTNQYTDICGAYELSIRSIVFDTGVDELSVRNALTRFSLDKKVEYVDGWVVVKNFLKHQQKNPNIEKGILRSIKELPENIKALIAFETPSHLNPNLNLNPNLKEQFDRVWKVYPKKVAKADALKAFQKLNPTKQITENIISSIEIYSKTPQWQDNDGRYIPHPATFLNRESFDEPPAKKGPKIVDWELTEAGAMKPIFDKTT